MFKRIFWLIVGFGTGVYLTAKYRSQLVTVYEEKVPENVRDFASANLPLAQDFAQKNLVQPAKEVVSEFIKAHKSEI